MFENFKNATNGVVVAIASPSTIASKVVEKLQLIFRDLDVSLGVHLRSDLRGVPTVEQLSRVDKLITEAGLAKSRLTLLNYAIHELLLLEAGASIDQFDQLVAKLVRSPDYVYHIVTTIDINDPYNAAIKKIQWGKHRVMLGISEKSSEDDIAETIFGLLVADLISVKSDINFL